jgi:hypothetical protein
MGTESAAGKRGHDIKCHIKWLGLSIRLLGVLRCTCGISF